MSIQTEDYKCRYSSELAGHPLLEKKRCCRCRYLAKIAAAAAACRCRYSKKINSTRKDGIQIRYLIVKFQLYLRKLIIQAFSILVQVTIGISRLKWLTSKQITTHLGVGMLLSKKQAFQNADWLNQRFRNYLGSYPWKLH